MISCRRTVVRSLFFLMTNRALDQLFFGKRGPVAWPCLWLDLILKDFFTSINMGNDQKLHDGANSRALSAAQTLQSPIYESLTASEDYCGFTLVTTRQHAVASACFNIFFLLKKKYFFFLLFKSFIRLCSTLKLSKNDISTDEIFN